MCAPTLELLMQADLMADRPVLVEVKASAKLFRVYLAQASPI